METPIEPGRNGLTCLVPCLLSHAPVDLVIIMLGTHDLKQVFGLGAPEIAGGKRWISRYRQGRSRWSRSTTEGRSGILTEVRPVVAREPAQMPEAAGGGDLRDRNRRRVSGRQGPARTVE